MKLSLDNIVLMLYMAGSLCFFFGSLISLLKGK